MNLTNYEEVILGLYKEIYGKEYNVLDKEVMDDEITLKRDVLSQNLLATLSKLDNVGKLIGNYGFILNQYGPYSFALDDILHNLSLKKKEIEEFYKKGYNFTDDEYADIKLFKDLIKNYSNKERIIYLLALIIDLRDACALDLTEVEDAFRDRKGICFASPEEIKELWKIYDKILVSNEKLILKKER